MGRHLDAAVKLLDGISFASTASGSARRTTFDLRLSATWPMALPSTGWSSDRTDFAPDGRRAVGVGLTLSAGAQSATVNLNVDSNSG